MLESGSLTLKYKNKSGGLECHLHINAKITIFVTIWSRSKS